MPAFVRGPPGANLSPQMQNFMNEPFPPKEFTQSQAPSVPGGGSSTLKSYGISLEPGSIVTQPVSNIRNATQLSVSMWVSVTVQDLVSNVGTRYPLLSFGPRPQGVAYRPGTGTIFDEFEFFPLPPSIQGPANPSSVYINLIGGVDFPTIGADIYDGNGVLIPLSDFSTPPVSSTLFGGGDFNSGFLAATLGGSPVWNWVRFSCHTSFPIAFNGKEFALPVQTPEVKYSSRVLYARMFVWTNVELRFNTVSSSFVLIDSTTGKLVATPAVNTILGVPNPEIVFDGPAQTIPLTEQFWINSRGHAGSFNQSGSVFTQIGP